MGHPPVVLLREDDQTKGEATLRFEILRLDDIDGTPVDTTVVDAASVNRIVQQAAAIGQRLWIRPAETPAS
ncbi:hypothetical protein RKD49_005148 [Streptomyces glaucescens]